MNHVLDVWGVPWCGAEPNDEASIAEVDIDNPDVLDALEVCEGCVDQWRQAQADQPPTRRRA